jgi:alpha-glucosidase
MPLQGDRRAGGRAASILRWSNLKNMPISSFLGSFVERPSASLLLAFLTLAMGTGREARGAEGWPPPGAISLQSSDGSIEVIVGAIGPLKYSVNVDGQPVVEPSRLGLRLRGGVDLGSNAQLDESSITSHDSTWENPLGKRRVVRDQYNELRLSLDENGDPGWSFDVIIRAYDDGVAIRYVLPRQRWQTAEGLQEVVVEADLTEFKFPDNYACYAGHHAEDRFRGPQEWHFTRQRLSDIRPESVMGLPVLVETPAAWVAIGEADLLNWAGMWIGGAATAAASSGPVTLVAKLAPRLDGKGAVKSKLPVQSSWRVLMIGREPGRLIESEIVRNLSTPSKLDDASWIQPGMMAWDHWWTGDTIMDTATMKAYIQLAADMGWEYQLIDAGWYGDWPDYGETQAVRSDITTVIDALDMDELRRFAKEKGVRLWVWLKWDDVDRDDAYKRAFPLYEQWGIAGVKIDYMDRDDQEMVNWYEKITKAAAECHLLVIFHGAFKMSGFDRTYPNQVTREGVLGNEYNKWSKLVTPEHKVTLPFTRYLEGPADFTPGGFLNRQPEAFRTNVKPTQVQGTRAAELALFVVYDSPVACVCEHPDRLRNQPGTDFLKIVPTVWDDTRVLDGVVGRHIVMARRSGDEWYLGALTNEDGREISVPLDFLGDGQWKLSMWQDAADADQNAEHLKTRQRTVSADDTLVLELAPAGGCVARFEKL